MRRLATGIWSVLADAYRTFAWHLGALKAGSVAFFATLSMVPFAIVVVSIVGRAVGSEQALSQVRAVIGQYLPAAEQPVLAALRQARPGGSTLLPNLLGGLALFWSAATLFTTLSQVLTVVWFDEPRHGFIRQRIIGFLAVVVAGMLFLASMIVTSIATTVASYAEEVNFFPSAHAVQFFHTAAAWAMHTGIAVILFAVLYWTMPLGKVSWKAAVAAALPAGVLWSIARSFFAVLVAQSGRYGQLYGPLAGAVVLLLWIYTSAWVMIYCGEIGATLQARYWSIEQRR